VKVAIIGSRDYPRLPAVTAYVRSLPPDTLIVSGGAPGVDVHAARAARAFGYKLVEAPVDTAGLPDDPDERRIEYAKRAYARNAWIVAYADEVVAFWTNCTRPNCRRPQPHKTHGTAHALSEAARLGKPVNLFGPSGRLSEPGR
jgi:hypothetical protein